MPDGPPTNPESKRSRGRSARIPSLNTTSEADRVAKELQATLVRMFDSAALMRANRRRATAIDRVDYEAAFDDVVNPSPRPKRLGLIGDICGIFGAGFVGYSINIYSGSGTVTQVGHVALLAGAVLSLAGACLKYVDPSR